MNPFSELSSDNDEQIRKYLKFFRTKKEATLRGLSNEFEDIKQDRLNEDMFSKDDMIDFADSILSSITSHVANDLSLAINMNALLVSQLFEQGQNAGVELSINTGSVENQALLNAVERMNIDGPKSAQKKKAADVLPSFKEDSRALQQEAKAMKEETERLTAANKTLSDRFTMMQTEASRLNKENSALKNDLSDLQQRLGRVESSAKRSDDSKVDSSQVRRLEEELRRLKEESTKRVADSSQFQQMKDLMKSQTFKIKDLRRRLQRYEPDDDGKAGSDDDDC